MIQRTASFSISPGRLPTIPVAGLPRRRQLSLPARPRGPARRLPRARHTSGVNGRILGPGTAGSLGAGLPGPRRCSATLISAALPAPFQLTFRRPPPARPLRPARSPPATAPARPQTDSAPPPLEKYTPGPSASAAARACVRARVRACVRRDCRDPGQINCAAVALWSGGSCGLGPGPAKPGSPAAAQAAQTRAARPQLLCPKLAARRLDEPSR